MSFLKSIWRGNSRHKKLCEEWALTNSTKDLQPTENVLPGASFLVKYLGSTLVEAASNERATAEAIKSIISMAKASGKKLARASLRVSLRGITVVEVGTDAALLQVSIYRISYCSADAAHDHVFAFITTNPDETLECHAFLCPKRKIAQAVTLTVARSFNTVYELYHMSECADADADRAKTFRGFCSKLDESKIPVDDVNETKGLLIDLDEPQHELALNDSNTSWVSFDNDDERWERSGNRPRPLVFAPQRQFPTTSNRVPDGNMITSAWSDASPLL